MDTGGVDVVKSSSRSHVTLLLEYYHSRTKVAGQAAYINEQLLRTSFMITYILIRLAGIEEWALASGRL